MVGREVSSRLTFSEPASTYTWAAKWTFAFLLVVGVMLVAGPVRGLVGLAIVVGTFAFSRPLDGLWLSLAILMLASLIAPPAGFEAGAGYSPELTYWAIATCVLLTSLSLNYLWNQTRSVDSSTRSNSLHAPTSFYAFAAVCVLCAIIGLVRGYTILNVAKQFYGCLLFLAYFLFSLRFAPESRRVDYVSVQLVRACLFFAVMYIALYLYHIPTLGIHKELTVLSGYSGGLAVLYLPGVRWRDLRNCIGKVAPMLTLMAVPLLAQYKRAILGFVICAFLSIGLQSASMRKRYFAILAAFALFTVFVVTDFLGPVGRALSKYDSLKMLFPEDIQSSYSVFLRFEETRQVLNSIGGVPIFGTGLGSTFTWYDPLSHTLYEEETMELGWAYLLVKMGIVGTLFFLWFAGQLFRDALRFPLSQWHLAIFLLVVFQLLQMVADPFVLNFMTSGWAGMTCGFLYILNKDRRSSKTLAAALSVA
jgi:hypothetical protein